MGKKTKQKIILACRGGSFRDILSVELEKSGFDVYAADNGTSALEAALFRRPEALIVDSPLDVIPRDTLVKILRANPVTKDTPIVALCRDEKDIPGLLQVIDIALKKPLKTSDIVSRVAALFQEDDMQPEDGRETVSAPNEQPKKVPHLELVKSDPVAQDDVVDFSFEEFIDSVQMDKKSAVVENDADHGWPEVAGPSFEAEETMEPPALHLLEDTGSENDAEPFKIFPDEAPPPVTGDEGEIPYGHFHEPVVLEEQADETNTRAIADDSGRIDAEIKETAEMQPPLVEQRVESAAEKKEEITASTVVKEDNEQEEDVKEETIEKPARPAPALAVSLRTFDLKMEKEMIGLFRYIERLLPAAESRVIQFIGSREGEGTSTIAREFAKVMAVESDKAVLLMDADFSNPSQHLYFDVEPGLSLEEIIRNGKALESALSQVGNTHLYLNRISKDMASTLKILNSPMTDTLFDLLRKRYDLILIDSPPAAASPESLVLTSRVDGVVLVVEAEVTRWMVAASVKDRIEKNGGNLLGVVLNKRRYHIPDFFYKRLK